MQRQTIIKYENMSETLQIKMTYHLFSSNECTYHIYVTYIHLNIWNDLKQDNSEAYGYVKVD